MRLIDADALEPSKVYMNYGFTRIVYMDDIDEMPTIEAEPTRHGEWIGKPIINGYSRVRCSVCDDVFLELENNGKWKYCPHCGARMDEDEISNIAKESAGKIAKALEKVRAKGMQKQNIKEDDEP